MRRRKRWWDRIPPHIAIPIAVVALMLSIPVLMPWMHIVHRRERRRLHAAAEAQPCPACGRPLGVAALAASDEHWRAHIAELRRAYPGHRLRLLRRVHAHCTACGARLRFCEESGTFTVSSATA